MLFGRYVFRTIDVNVGSVHHFSQNTNTEISTSKSKTMRHDIVHTQALSLQDPNMHCTRESIIVYTEVYERNTKAKGNIHKHCQQASTRYSVMYTLVARCKHSFLKVNSIRVNIHMCSTSAYLCCITRCKICKCTRQHQIEYTHHKEIGARQKEQTPHIFAQVVNRPSL